MRKICKAFAIAFAMNVFYGGDILAQHSNCSVAPYANTISQPDGKKITLVAYGNEAIHYLETTEGYTVLKNTNGFYEYAVIGNNGNLIPGGTIAYDGQANKTGLTPHLRYSEEQQSLLMQLFNSLHEEETALNKAGTPKPFPPTGERKVLVLLVEYPDLRATVPKENFELLINQPGYNGTGSFKDFYKATSNGMLSITGDVYGWLMADTLYKGYGKESSPAYSSYTRKLLLGAVADANDSFDIDFSQYDNDGDGYVDGVIIMHAGIGAEEASAPNSGDYIWSFRSTLSAAQRPTYDGVQVAAYAMFPEKRYNSGAMSMVGIGVLSHEFGHLLDLPDLYATQYGNEGAGNYSLMAGGPWLNGEKTPCFNDAWSRWRMGWVEPVVITEPGLYTLPHAIVDSDMVYRINTSRTNEFYMLENRQRKGFDRYLPSKGMAIWHVNTNRAKLLSEASNNVNNDTSQLGVGLIQADGLRHLEMNSNRGDGTDLYPVASNRNFTPTTKPASTLHFKAGGIKQPSNVAITDVIQLADSGITFEFGLNASAAFNADRLSGCAPLNINFTNNTSGGESFLWDFGNGITSNLATPAKHTFSKTGQYEVKLTIFKANEPVDSNIMTITVDETPEISYTYTRDENYNLAFGNTTKYGKTYSWVFGFDTTIRSNEVNPVIQLDGPVKMMVRLTATSNDGCVRSFQDSIQIYAVGLNNNIAERISLNAYPNPFSNKIRVTFSNARSLAPSKIEVYNLLGEKVMETVTAGGSVNQDMELDTETLTQGVYLIKVLTGGEQAWIKSVKH